MLESHLYQSLRHLNDWEMEVERLLSWLREKKVTVAKGEWRFLCQVHVHGVGT